MSEERIRKEAVSRYIRGESPKTIYTESERSEKWFFKWLKRYKSGQQDWYKDQPRVPLNMPKRISEVDKQRIIETGRRPESEPFARIGVSAIRWELSRSGFSLPSDRTVSRVLRREGLIRKNTHMSPKVLNTRISERLNIPIIFIRLTWQVPDI